jgi:uncharacterized membrane protein YgcG
MLISGETNGRLFRYARRVGRVLAVVLGLSVSVASQATTTQADAAAKCAADNSKTCGWDATSATSTCTDHPKGDGSGYIEETFFTKTPPGGPYGCTTFAYDTTTTPPTTCDTSSHDVGLDGDLSDGSYCDGTCEQNFKLGGVSRVCLGVEGTPGYHCTTFGTATGTGKTCTTKTSPPTAPGTGGGGTDPGTGTGGTGGSGGAGGAGGAGGSGGTGGAGGSGGAGGAGGKGGEGGKGGDGLDCSKTPNILACRIDGYSGGGSCIAPPSISAGSDPLLGAIAYQQWQLRCAQDCVAHPQLAACQDKAVVVGGANCGTAPTCKGDEAQCAIVMNTWRTACTDVCIAHPDRVGCQNKNTASGGGDCKSPPTCSGDPAMCMIANQTWQTRCAIAGTDKPPDDSANTKQPDDVKEVRDFTPDMLDHAGWLSGGACPNFGDISVLGVKWDISGSDMCSFYQAIGLLFQLLCAVKALNIALRG